MLMTGWRVPKHQPINTKITERNNTVLLNLQNIPQIYGILMGENKIVVEI